MSNPIQLNTILNTQERLVPDQTLKSSFFSIASELGFCVKDDTSGSPTLRVVFTQDQSQDLQIPMKADQAILNPADPSICVLRTNQLIQAMSLSTKTPLGRYVFPAPVQIDFWQWIDEKRLAIVQSDGVYIWSYETPDTYQSVLYRDAQLIQGLEYSKITNFQMEGDWAILQCVGVNPTTQQIAGNLQLHSFSKQVSKVIPAHSSTLLTYQEDKQHPSCTLLAFALKSASAPAIDINVMECGPQKDAAGNPLSGFQRQTFQIAINPAIAPNEFPMHMRSNSKLGFIFTITKTGILYIHDAISAILISQQQISHKPTFSVSDAQHCDIVLASADGKIQTLLIDEASIVDFVMTRLNKQSQAVKLSMRANLAGADKLFMSQFESFFSQKEWKKAADVVKNAPGNCLRTQEILKRFADAAVNMGEKPPVLVYLGELIAGEGVLVNVSETMELVKSLAANGKIAAVEQLFAAGKLFACEALGDTLMQNGMDKLAFKVYNGAKCHEKCILYLITQNQLDSIVRYVERFPEYQPDYSVIINKGLQLGAGLTADGVERLRNFANTVIGKIEAENSAQIIEIAESFKTFGYIKEASYLLLEVIKKLQFSDQSGPFQTSVIAFNLEADPVFAEALLAKNKLNWFDRSVIYAQCETAQLYQRAFEYAPDDSECVRIASFYAQEAGRAIFAPEFFAQYCLSCGKFVEETQETIDALFEFIQNLLMVQIGDLRIYAPHVAQAFSVLPIIAASPELSVAAIQVFESFDLSGSEALFSFLKNIFPSSVEPAIHTLYLKCAVQGNKEQDILLVARESTVIEGQEAFDVLTQTSTKSEPTVITALLTICMRFNLSKVLASFLCEICVKNPKNMHYFISNSTAILEQFLTAFAPEQCDQILEALFENGVMSSQEVNVLDGIFTVDFLSRVIASQQVRERCNIDKVVTVCMKNQKTIRIVREMLEQRLIAGAIDQQTHTAFAKILMETRDQAIEKFLVEDPYYDHCNVVEYCLSNDRRRRDSFIQNMTLKCAVVGAFSPINPIEIRNTKALSLIVETGLGCSLYREMAVLLLKRGSLKLWELSVMDKFTPIYSEFFYLNNQRSLEQHREYLIQAVQQNTSVAVEKLDDNVIAAAIGPLVRIQDKDPKVSKCIMVLLERVILTPGSVHGKNTALHNLLIIAAVKARELSSVQKYVKMTELVYDPDVIAKVCVQVATENNMPEFYEYAFEVFRRYDRLPEAVDILIHYMGLKRAEEFSEQVNQSAVFAVLGAAQLKIAVECMGQNSPIEACSLITRGCKSLTRSKDMLCYKQVIQTVFKFNKDFAKNYETENVSNFNNSIEYLRTTRTVMFLNGAFADQVEVDTALMYCYVRHDKFDELEQFLSMTDSVGQGVVPNKGDIIRIGERAFSEKRYYAAKLLFSKMQVWNRLACTFLKLEDWSNAVDSARRADNIDCWRTVNAACILANQVQYAKTAGMYLITIPDELPRCIRFYENNGFIKELIDLLEAGIEHPQAKAFTNKEQNLFTACGVLIAKYLWYVDSAGSQRLMRFLRAHFERISIPLVISTAKQEHLWKEVVYLYILSKEVDKAIEESLNHPSYFEHKQFLQICGQCTQIDLLTQSTGFYMRYYPQHLAEFLKISKQGYYHNEDLIDAKQRDNLSVDPLHVLRLARENEIIFLITEYLELCVEDNINETNNSLVQYYIDTRNAKKLQPLLARCTAFDALRTLDDLTNSPISQLKRVAATLYSTLKRYDEGIRFAVQNSFYDEAATVAHASEDPKRVEILLRLICASDFKDKSQREEIFATAVSRCDTLAPVDVVMELGWRCGMSDYAMPYMISKMAMMTSIITDLQKKNKEEEVEKILAPEKEEYQEFQEEEEQWAPADNW
ncbi:Clathrin heavy chain [Spironucleus salmonicida]|uniref:Clathrin heavy chain n=1 Tax=Spironucleus salmonicida TaxID=348837 RepID=V6LQ88_9EUKA|nr:Clathrin heavy chain [Spironucleus salmonicida]|eukprot:EST45876.1 Clathrin heavy chain [Spironucleus salmonicida]